jgi:response regulator RpfG family c-di-GMP phosphodiesterase
LHRALAEVVSAERECDRAARELLTLFEQRSLGRVKEETFERLVLEHTRRYEQWAGRVAEAISLIEREPW